MEIVPELLRSAEFAEFQKRADPQRNLRPLVAHRVTKGRGLPKPSPLVAQGATKDNGFGSASGERASHAEVRHRDAAHVGGVPFDDGEAVAFEDGAGGEAGVGLDL
jgi:hypothetical protein